MAIPHLAIPFRLNAEGTARTVAQDSVDDITQCVEVLCATPTGSRLELPSYGIPDHTFGQGAPPVQPIVAAVNRWEPRAQVAVTSGPGPQAAVNVAVSVP